MIFKTFVDLLFFTSIIITVIESFKPYFDHISFYSWLREPHFYDDYRERRVRDNQLLIHAAPERYEPASFRHGR